MQQPAAPPRFGRGRATFFWDEEKTRAEGALGDKSLSGTPKPAMPAGARHWKTPEIRQAKATPKRNPVQAKARPKSNSRPRYQEDLVNRDRDGDTVFAQAADPYYADNRGFRKDDPLNFKEPPREVDPSQMIADGEYLAAGLNPDSLLADVEALLVQEQMLAEQTKWWEDRAQEEKVSRRGLQDHLKIQQSSFRIEVSAMQREIDAAQRQLRQAEDEGDDAVNLLAGLRDAAMKARQEAKGLEHKLEEMATIATPREATRIRGSISQAFRGDIGPKTFPFNPRPSTVTVVETAKSSKVTSVAQSMSSKGYESYDSDEFANMGMLGGGQTTQSKQFGGPSSNAGRLGGSAMGMAPQPSGQQPTRGGGGGLAMGGLDLDFGSDDDDLDMADLGF